MRGSGARIGIVRAIVVGAAVAGALAVLSSNDDEVLFPGWIGWALAGGLLVAAGALVNRVWAAQLPIVFVVCWVLGRAAIEGTGYDTWGELGVGGALVFAIFFGAGMGVLALAGAAIRRAVRAARRGRSQRSDFSPQNDA